MLVCFLFVCLLLHVAALGFTTASWVSSSHPVSVFLVLRPRQPHSHEVRLDLFLSYFDSDSRTLFCPCVFRVGLPSCPRIAGRPGRHDILGFASSHLPSYCDGTKRAVGLCGGFSRWVASGARVTSCSHSRFEGETLANVFPTLPFAAARARFRHPDFLGRCSQELVGWWFAIQATEHWIQLLRKFCLDACGVPIRALLFPNTMFLGNASGH